MQTQRRNEEIKAATEEKKREVERRKKEMEEERRNELSRKLDEKLAAQRDKQQFVSQTLIETSAIIIYRAR